MEEGAKELTLKTGQATGRNVIVRMQPQKKLTSGGIYLPEPVRAQEWIGRIVSVGPKCRYAVGCEGRGVVLDEHSPTGKRLSGDNPGQPDDPDYWIGPEDEILGILEEQEIEDAKHAMQFFEAKAAPQTSGVVGFEPMETEGGEVPK